MSAILHSNRLQIARAVEMALSTGKKKVGVLGFSFKAGTDDLRESPMVTVIETLIGKGLQLAVYDRDVSLARLFGANKEFIEREIPHISRLMRPTIEEVLDESDLIIVGNRAVEFLEVPHRLRADQKLIDLVRLFEDPPVNENYEGICW
jgi:GDP-mannose 6-dehydrogenase